MSRDTGLFRFAAPLPTATIAFMRLSALGDSAIVLTLGKLVDDAMLARVQAVATAIRQRAIVGVVDVVPAFASVTVYYDVARGADYARLQVELESAAQAAEIDSLTPRRVEIPVTYGGAFGPDLEVVATHANRTAAEVIAAHAGADYRVQAIGFVPGFAYLGGLPETIHVPRRATPRPEVAGGSVGIGGSQTGVYPLATPGGWNLIGRTPLRLFDPCRTEPALLRTGDAVTFRAIDAETYSRLADEAQSASAETSPTTGDDATQNTARLKIEVRKPGLLTTVQDTGRRGQRASGVPSSGGADAFALRVANLLVGNAEDAAGLEVTLLGPELYFSDEALVALTGAEFDGLPPWRPARVARGQVLKLGTARKGCRGYLAVAGGITVAPVLGSRSTYLRAAFGGHEGRALREGDVVSAPLVSRHLDGHWCIDPRILPAYAVPATVRVVRGAQTDEFSAAFLKGDFAYHVSPQSDRMGVRLVGPQLARRGGDELRSAAVVPGTIQVPPDGQPIVLLADAQTLGGYPQVAHVISPDLPIVAQLRPGDAVRFVAVSLDEAHRLAAARERALALLREGLRQKLS